MLPSSSVSTSPYAVGFATGVSTIVAFALRSRCSRDDRREVDLGQDVAVEDDDRLVQRLAGVADGASCAERHGFDHVADAQAGVAAVAEDLLDAARLVVEAEDDLVDLRHLLQADRADSGGTGG